MAAVEQGLSKVTVQAPILDGLVKVHSIAGSDGIVGQRLMAAERVKHATLFQVMGHAGQPDL